MRIGTLGICCLLLLTSCTSSGDDDAGPEPGRRPARGGTGGQGPERRPLAVRHPGRPRQPVRPAGRRTGHGRRDEGGRAGRRGDRNSGLDLGLLRKRMELRDPGCLGDDGRRLEGDLGADDRRAVPEGRRDARRRHPARRNAETSSVPVADGWSRRATWSTTASTRPWSRRPGSPRVPAGSRRCSTSTPAPYVKQAEAAGPKAFVEAIVLRDADARHGRPVATATSPAPRPSPAQLPLAPTARVRGADPRPRRPGHRRDRSRSPTARSRPATSSGCPASRRGTTSSCRALRA